MPDLFSDGPLVDGYFDDAVADADFVDVDGVEGRAPDYVAALEVER